MSIVHTYNQTLSNNDVLLLLLFSALFAPHSDKQNSSDVQTLTVSLENGADSGQNRGWKYLRTHAIFVITYI